uniref:zinc ribbon domain-containing protein n=1 Tax=Micromonospora purpureochromogenes TaxID=47872 RepID=UPI00358DC074
MRAGAPPFRAGVKARASGPGGEVPRWEGRRGPSSALKPGGSAVRCTTGTARARRVVRRSSPEWCAAPLNVRAWDCPCGGTHDRDVNAAMNVLAAGRAESLNACGAQVRPAPVPAPREEAGILPDAACSTRSVEGISVLQGGEIVNSSPTCRRNASASGPTPAPASRGSPPATPPAGQRADRRYRGVRRRVAPTTWGVSGRCDAA